VRGAAWIPIAVGGLGAALLFFGDAKGRKWAQVAGKLAASGGFVALALILGVETPYARILLAGLLLAFVGDACLLSTRQVPFLAGLVAFLLAHVIYAVAFARVSSPAPWVVAPLLVALAAVLRWLWPHLGPMRLAVAVYCVAISAMLWFALGTPAPGVWVGAFLFYLSDLTVARDRFVAAERRNLLVGHPLYFAGQYLIALSVG
jgi:uncharacterized membrane protein YhhN